MRTLISLAFISTSLFAVAVDRKELDVVRITERVEVDGILNETFWTTAKIASDFTQHKPVAGAHSLKKTEVKVAYDNQAIYIAGIMYDNIDSMTRTLSQRDDLGNADWFGVIFDPYNSGTIGFAFLVTSAGVQVDELHQVNNIDANWNAVWQSAVTINQDNWTVEIKIPFSALRFPSDAQQTWGINFARNIRRKREESFWNFYDPKGINLISQLGQLKGISDIESPVRLSFTPYLSGYINHNGAINSTNFTGSGGMDLKYGLNESFTVDMTLIPDFGQVQFDNNVLNLSPFEVRYNERRQFFTEGTELFTKGDLFYSRRIGGTPINYSDAYVNLDSNEYVESNPGNVRLLNATKLSGRTNYGLGVGLFNGIVAESKAIIRNTVTNERREVITNPFTNYNVFVLDQNLKNNSSVTLVNTSVLREGHTYDANVSLAGFDLYSKEQKYNAYGQFTLSQIYSVDSTDLGHSTYFGIAKSAGQLLWELNYSESSENYNPNDLGYFFFTNQRHFTPSIGYNIYEPFWRLYRLWSNINLTYSRNINPDNFANFFIVGEVGGTFKNFMTAGIWTQIEPVLTFDYYEPRVAGRFYEYPQNFRIGGFISSDYSKPFSLDMEGAFIKFNDEGRYRITLSTSPRIRFSDKLFLILTNYVGYDNNDEGAAVTYYFSIPFDDVDPIFGIRNRLTTENIISASYIFNNKMGVTFRLRHYWSKVKYNEFYALDDLGRFKPTNYTGLDADNKSLHDNSFDAFTIDLVYRWVFAPGSELSLVWKNSIFASSQEINNNYFQNFGALTGNPANNTISLKLLYYLDYWTLRQKMKKD